MSTDHSIRFWISILVILVLSACTPGAPTQPSESTGFEAPALEVLTVDNAYQLIELGRWGAGLLRQAVYSADGHALLVVTTEGVYQHDLRVPGLPVSGPTLAGSSLLSPHGGLAFTPGALRTLPNGALQAALPETFQPLVFSPGEHLLAGNDGGLFTLLDTSTGAAQFSMPGPVDSAAVSPNEELLAVGYRSNPVVRVIRIANGATLAEFEVPDEMGDIPSGIESLAFSPDGLELAVGVRPGDYYDEDGGAIDIFDLATGERRLRVPGIGRREVGPGGACNEDRYLPHPPAPAAPTSLAFTPDGSTLWAHYTTGRLVGYHSQDGSQLWKTHAGGGFTLSPSSREIAVFKPSGILEVRELTTGELRLTIPGYTGRINRLAFSPGHPLLGLAAAGQVILLDAAGEGQVFSTSGRSFAFHPGGELLAVGLEDGGLALYHLPSGDQEQGLPGHTAAVSDLLFLPDGTLISTAEDCTTIQWNIGERRLERAFEPVELPGFFTPTAQVRVNALQISENGQALLGNIALEYGAGAAASWSLSDGRFTGLAPSPIEVEGSAGAASPDGSLWAQSVFDLRQTVIEIQDALTGEVLLALELPGLSVSQLEFAPNGTRLAAGTSSGTVITWGVPSPQDSDQ